MNHIVVDIEASCWKGWEKRDLMETIEIGAVKLGPDFEKRGEFTIFIQPVRIERLSDFCTELTSITQQDVDQADRFPAAFEQFLGWIGAEEPFCWYSWGNYDYKQLFKDIAYHQVPYPAGMEAHTNLKGLFAAKNRLDKQVGLHRALKMKALPFEGRAHRGIDDARNIAILAQQLLP